MMYTIVLFLLFFFNDTATTEIYTLSLHDALPIYFAREQIGIKPFLHAFGFDRAFERAQGEDSATARYLQVHAVFADRKSTRLNSSHSQISYAVFCLKKKKETDHHGDITLHHSTVR